MSGTKQKEPRRKSSAVMTEVEVEVEVEKWWVIVSAKKCGGKAKQ